MVAYALAFGGFEDSLGLCLPPRVHLLCRCGYRPFALLDLALFLGRGIATEGIAA